MASLISSDFSIETDLSNNVLQSTNELIVPFWSDNPNVVLQGKYIAELFPITDMTFNQKLNAITRTVLILTVLLFLFYRNIRIPLIGLLTLGSIYLLHHYRQKECNKKLTGGNKEGFNNPALAVLQDYDIDRVKTFDKPSDTNPFSNVLLPDYDYNPNKKPAPPAFNTNVNQTIMEQAKQLVIDQNPGQPDIANKLFTDLGEQFVFEQSLQPFYSNAATTIPNDQAGFADFCYGSMVSCKEGNLFACARNLDRYTN
jgi:hypothetical protein